MNPHDEAGQMQSNPTLRVKFTEEEKMIRARESKRRWRLRNPEKQKAAQRRWNDAHPDKVAAHAMATRARGKGACATYLRKWRKGNPGKAAEYNRRKYHKNPEKNRTIGRIHAQNRRGRMAGGKLSLDLAARLLITQANVCAYCPADLRVTGYHLDHVNPLSKGGRHEDANIALACPACNLSKHAKDPEEFRLYRCAAV